MIGSLHNGYQEVWIREHSFLSPSGGNQRESSGGLLYIQALRQEWKVEEFRFPGELTQE